MATKCKGWRPGIICPVRNTCMHFLDSGSGDVIQEPKKLITTTGCTGYQRMSRERFESDYRKMKEKWK